MRIIIRPIGQPRDLDVTEWLVEAIAAQLGRCSRTREDDCGADRARQRERNRRAARKHIRLVIEGFCELAEDEQVQRRIGIAQGDCHEVGSIFAYPDMLGGGRKLTGGDGVAITDNTRRPRIRMAPKLVGADDRVRQLGARAEADRTSGEKAAAP